MPLRIKKEFLCVCFSLCVLLMPFRLVILSIQFDDSESFLERYIIHIEMV